MSTGVNNTNHRRAELKLNALVLAFFLVLMTIGSSCALQPSSPNDNRDSGMSSVTPENANIRRPTKHDAMDTIRGEVPAEVKSAFSKAATVTVQHKELTLDQVKSIERESEATIVGSDFHSFTAQDRSQRQIGAATISEIKQSEMRLLIVFTPLMKIKNVTVVEGSRDLVGRPFFDQFAGKDSKNVFRIGQDLKYDGPNKQDAGVVARVIKRDVLAMHALYASVK